MTRDVGVDSSLLGPYEVLVHGEQRALGSPGGEDGPGVVVAGQLADVGDVGAGDQMRLVREQPRDVGHVLVRARQPLVPPQRLQAVGAPMPTSIPRRRRTS